MVFVNCVIVECLPWTVLCAEAFMAKQHWSWQPPQNWELPCRNQRCSCITSLICLRSALLCLSSCSTCALMIVKVGRGLYVGVSLYPARELRQPPWPLVSSLDFFQFWQHSSLVLSWLASFFLIAAVMASTLGFWSRNFWLKSRTEKY